MEKPAARAMRPSTTKMKSRLVHVEGRDQGAEIGEALEAEGADRERHGAEGADGREMHDDADDAEEDLAGSVDAGRDPLAGLAEPRYGDAGEDGDEQHLQQVALGEDVAVARRDDGQQVRRDAVVLGGRHVGGDGGGIERLGIDVEAGAGLHHVGHDEADGERQGRDDLEVERWP